MDNKHTSQTPIKPLISGEVEFLGGCIRVKISVKNTSDKFIFDASLDFESDERILHFIRCEPEYPEKKGKIQLGNINPGTDRTIALDLDPLVCESAGIDINCRVSFKDSFEIPDSVQMETLNIKLACPILVKEQEINIGKVKELMQELQFKESKVYIFPGEMELQDILKSCNNIIQLRNVKHIKTFKTTDERTYESWYYGKTTATEKDILVKCSIRKVTKSIGIQASGNDQGNITGLLSQIGHDLTNAFETLGKIQPVYNLHIKDYIIQRSDLLNFCDHDGNISGNILIENIVVQRSNASSENNGKRKQSEKEEEKRRQSQGEQLTKTGRLKRKQEDEELFEINRKKQSDKNVGEEEQKNREKKKQEISQEEVNTQNTQQQEHRPRNKEQKKKEKDDKIEIIPKRPEQEINVKTTIINQTQELSNSGYQEERGVNFEGIDVDRLVGFLTNTCKNILIIVDEFPIDSGRLLFLASDVVGKQYYLLTAVVREYEGLTQVLLRANSDKNYGVNCFLNEILDNLHQLVIRASARKIGIISKEQVTIIIDSVVHSVEEERARRKREEQEKSREEEAKKRKKEEQEKLRQKEQEENKRINKKDAEAKKREKENQDQKRVTKADLSPSQKKERIFFIIFAAMALMVGFLALEYWVLAPFASDTNRSLGSSPTLPGSFTNSNDMEFVFIREGEFDMGSPLNEANRANNEGPVHHVKIPDAFYIGKYEVTQKQWRRVMGNNPSTFKGDDLPVEQVSWNDAQEFIKKLNENEHVNKYRLPTEAQWEYAARAGTKKMYSFGENESKIGDYAWYIGNSEGKTHNVGLKKPNQFGLFDMHGNVYEWVQDSYYDNYKVAPKDGSGSSSRVFRGGSWVSNSGSCRSANREDNDQGTRASNLGFRLVRDL